MTPARGALLCAGLSVIGLVVAGYLGMLHLALIRGEVLGGPLCGGMGTAFNCHAVAASAIGHVLNVPLAFWGILGYVVTLALAIIAWQCPDDAPRALTLLAGVAAACVAIDAALLFVMVRQLRVVCALCLATYGLNAAIALVARAAAGRPWRSILREWPPARRLIVPAPRAPIAWAFWGVVLAAAAGLFSVRAAAGFFGRPPAEVQAQIRRHLEQAPRVSVDTAGDPRIGDPAAPFQIVTFSDFLCPLCQATAKYHAIIAAAHPGQVSLVAKVFPLDQACNTTIPRTVHPGACQLAAASECAHAQGKFWALHDRIFEKGPAYLVADLERDAQRAGLDLAAFRQCLAGGDGAAAVTRDIAEAAKLGVTGTPATIINGIMISGPMTPAQFDELARVLRELDPALRQSS